MTLLSQAGKPKKNKKGLSAKELVQRARTRRHQRAIKKKHDKERREDLDQQILTALTKSQKGCSHATQEDATPTTFHRFKQLPPELRRLIWVFALPGPRVFEPFILMRPEYDTGCLLHYKHAPPTIRGVCKESWLITEEHGSFMFGEYQLRGDCDPEYYGMNGCWFNPRRDILYLSPKAIYQDPEKYFCPEYEDNVHHIEYQREIVKKSGAEVLAFRWEFFRHYPRHIWAYLDTDNPIRTIVLMEEKADPYEPTSSRRGTAFRLQDTDIVIAQHTDPEPEAMHQWAEVREVITKQFWDAGVDAPDSCWRPSKIEGMQLVRRPAKKTCTENQAWMLPEKFQWSSGLINQT